MDIIISSHICKIKMLIFLISKLIILFETANNFWSNDKRGKNQVDNSVKF